MIGRYIHTPNVHIHAVTDDTVCLSGYCRSGKYHEMVVDNQNVMYYNSGSLIQDAFPSLSASEREFLMTGMCCDPLWDHKMEFVLDEPDDTTCPF